MDIKLQQDLTHRLVSYLHTTNRHLEAEWATAFWIEGSIIHVYGKAPHRVMEYPIHLVDVPLQSFNRYMEQNKTRSLIVFHNRPALCKEDDVIAQKIAGLSKELPRDPSHAAGEAGQPKPTSTTPAKTVGTSQTASPSASKVSTSTSSSQPR
jgi:hypothetical protein